MPSVGYHNLLWLAKESGFGSAADMAAGDAVRIPLIDENFKESWPLTQKESITGKGGWRGSERQGKTVGGALNAWLSYDQKETNDFLGTDLLLALALGSVNWDGINSVNQLQIADELAVFGTVDKIARYDVSTPASSIIWEIISNFVKSLEISGAAGDPIKVSAEFLAYNLLRTGTTNTAAELLALGAGKLIRTQANRVHFGDLSFRIGDISDALADGDRVQISSFSLKLDNKSTDAEFATPGATGIPAGNLTVQPVRSDIRDVTFEITLSRYENENFFAELASLSEFQADLIFTSDSNQVSILLPNMVVEDAEAAIGGPDLIPKKITFRCQRGADYSTEGNTYMKFADGTTLVTNEVGIETKDERAAAIWS